MKEIDSQSDNPKPQSNKFIIEKSTCWNFSKTIRIDVKPICLMVNKTPYNLTLIEKRFNSLTGEEAEDLEPILCKINELNGSICLSGFDRANASDSPRDGQIIKKYKFLACLDEYSILDSMNLTNSCKMISIFKLFQNKPFNPAMYHRWNNILV